MLPESGFERCHIGAMDRTWRWASTVVDQHVDRLAGGKCLDLLAQGLGIAHVGGNPAMRLSGSWPGQLRGKRAKPFFAARQQGHVSAESGQRLCRRQPDALGATAHQGVLAGEV